MNEEFIPVPQEIQLLQESASSLETLPFVVPTDKLTFDPAKGEVIITFFQENREERHPFQDFLYSLRHEGVKASTSEWIDLQKALAEGEVQGLDDLYVVSRALLVKDVTNYPDFDTVFGRMFYGVEPPAPQVEDGNYDDYDEPEEDAIEQIEGSQPEQAEEKEKPVQKEKEDIQEIAESTSQISEDVHGGNEATKDIKDSPNAGNQGEQKDNHGAEEGKSPESQQQRGEGGGQQKRNSEGGGNKEEEGEGGGKKNEVGEGGDGKKDNEAGGGKHKKKEKPNGTIKEGKGGRSARELVIERKYDQFKKDEVLNYEQLGRALSKLTTIIQEATDVPTGRLDAPATVASIANHAGIPELVWQEEAEKRPHVVLMFDVGGSTDDFRPIMEKLFAAAKDYLDDVEVFYFHNAIYGEVWPQKDGNWGKHFLPISDILKKDQDSRVIIVGDAWMAENELWEDGDGYDEKTGRPKHFPSGMESFKQVHRTFDHVVWINPILERNHDDMDDSGTIADIRKVFNMYDLSLSGIESAVRKLMEE